MNKGPAQIEAINLSVEILKSIKTSGHDLDYPLSEFLKVSLRIGESLAIFDSTKDNDEQQKAYKEAYINAIRAIYLSEILERIEDYENIPFDKLREKIVEIQDMIQAGMHIMNRLMGRRSF